MKTYKRHISSVAEAPANVIALACYLLLLFFWAFGSVLLLGIYLFEKRSELVKFHAMQAFVLWLLRCLLGGELPYESMAALLTNNPGYLQDPMGWEAAPNVLVFRLVVTGVIVLLAVLAGTRALQWKDWKAPLVGQIAAFICNRSVVAQYCGTEDVPQDCRIEGETEEIYLRGNETWEYSELLLPNEQMLCVYVPEDTEDIEAEAFIKEKATPSEMGLDASEDALQLAEQVNDMWERTTDNVDEAEILVEPVVEDAQAMPPSRFAGKVVLEADAWPDANSQLPVPMRDGEPLYAVMERPWHKSFWENGRALLAEKSHAIGLLFPMRTAHATTDAIKPALAESRVSVATENTMPTMTDVQNEKANRMEINKVDNRMLAEYNREQPLTAVARWIEANITGAAQTTNGVPKKRRDDPNRQLPAGMRDTVQYQDMYS